MNTCFIIQTTKIPSKENKNNLKIWLAMSLMIKKMVYLNKKNCWIPNLILKCGIAGKWRQFWKCINLHTCFSLYWIKQKYCGSSAYSLLTPLVVFCQLQPLWICRFSWYSKKNISSSTRNNDSLNPSDEKDISSLDDHPPAPTGRGATQEGRPSNGTFRLATSHQFTLSH